MQTLYERYHEQGFTVLAFPCNQFKNQDPGSDEEIVDLIRSTYHVTFPILAKIDVNGEQEAPLFHFLKEQKSGIGSSRIKWNFTKFLVSREGEVVKRYAPTKKPESIAKDIEYYLSHK